MKFSTGSSSSSQASDSLSRKSTLCIYTEDLAPPPEKMDSSSEAMELRRELDAVRSALQRQSESVLKQKHQLVEANHKLVAKDQRALTERRMRQEQLAMVLRSLILLESRLTREQNQIQVALKQKEKIIKLQQEEIFKLKTKKSYCNNCQQLLGFTSEQTNIETDPEFQSLESTDSRYQNGFTRSCSFREKITPSIFQKNTRLSKSFQLPKHDVVYGNTSSSEEGNTATIKGTYVKNKQAFIRKDVMRRSRKFSSRKQTNPFLENGQKRYSSQANSSSAEECLSLNYQANGDNDSTAHQIAHDIKRASKKIDQLMEENKIRETEHKEREQKELKTYAFKMESLHGIKRQTSEDINANRTLFLNNVLTSENNEKPWYVNISDQEQDLGIQTKKSGKHVYNKSKSIDSILKPTLSSGVLKAEVISARNEVLCNNVKVNATKRNSFGDINQMNKSSNQHENWYASASDQDEGPNCEIYKNNPVLECVNQILLQNSMDDSSNDNSKSSETPSPKTSTKRVQFSTLNSISYDDSAGDNGENESLTRAERRGNKIVKFSLETASEHSYEVPNTAQGYQYEIQSIYSNDYEPIITRNTDFQTPVPLPRTLPPNITDKRVPNFRGSIVKNIAANLENRSANQNIVKPNPVPMKIVNKRKVPRTPPALPPKPKNLASKVKTESTGNKSSTDDSDAVAVNQRITEVSSRKTEQLATSSNNSEPDYCSISEINVPVVTHNKRELLLIQPTVEIHSEDHQHTSQKNIAKVISLSRIQNKMSDMDIPKLPHVTEIIIPDDDDPKSSTSLSFATSNQKDGQISMQSFINTIPNNLENRNSIQMGTTVSTILSEINKNVNCEKPINLTELDAHIVHSPSQTIQSKDQSQTAFFDDTDKIDLSQNFEEFKIDDELCTLDAEEYRISSNSSDGSDVYSEQTTNLRDNETVKELPIPEKVINNTYRVEVTVEAKLKPESATRTELNKLTKSPMLSNKPDLLSNIENLETESIRNSDIDSSNSSASNSGSYNTVKCEPGMILSPDASRTGKISFDFFLESSGLSSKSIITPSRTYAGIRPPSANHKSVLKPKDVKMRIRTPMATNKNNEKSMTTAIKYFEPYL